MSFPGEKLAPEGVRTFKDPSDPGRDYHDRHYVDYEVQEDSPDWMKATPSSNGLTDAYVVIDVTTTRSTITKQKAKWLVPAGFTDAQVKEYLEKSFDYIGIFEVPHQEYFCYFEEEDGGDEDGEWEWKRIPS